MEAVPHLRASCVLEGRDLEKEKMVSCNTSDRLECVDVIKTTKLCVYLRAFELKDKACPVLHCQACRQ